MKENIENTEEKEHREDQENFWILAILGTKGEIITSQKIPYTPESQGYLYLGLPAAVWNGVVELSSNFSQLHAHLLQFWSLPENKLPPGCFRQKQTSKGPIPSSIIRWKHWVKSLLS